MSFFSFLAPPSTESDEDLVNRRIADLLANSRVEEAIQDIQPLARRFSSLICMKAAASLIQMLGIYRANPDVVENVLKIVGDLVRDESLDSHSNAGVLVNEDGSLSTIFRCMASAEPNVRILAVTVVCHLARLQLPVVQSFLLEDSESQNLVMRLADDPVETVRANFICAIPYIVSANESVQQLFAFQMMDMLVTQTTSSDAFVAVQALIECNSKTQKLFVETGHISRLVPAISSGDDKAGELLVTLFTSSDAVMFRRFALNTGLVEATMALVLGEGKSKSLFWRLLGVTIRGNEELTAVVEPSLEQMIATVLRTKDAEAGERVFCIESVAVTKANLVGVTLIQKLKKATEAAISSTEPKREGAVSVLSIGKSCILANRDTLGLFFGPPLSTGKCVFLHAIDISVRDDAGVSSAIASLEFIAAAIWESEVASERFVAATASSILVMCTNAQDQRRGLACLVLLEALLFRTAVPVFEKLVAAVNAAGPVTDLINVVDGYANSLDDNKGLCMWRDFVHECAGRIHDNADVLLNTAVRIEDGEQFAVCKAKLAEALRQKQELENVNARLVSENDEYRKEADTLGNHIEELTRALEQCDRHAQEDLSVSRGDEKAAPSSADRQDCEKIKELESEMRRIRGENEQLKEITAAHRIPDDIEALRRENRDLRMKLELSQQKTQELLDVQADYESLKQEMRNMLTGGSLEGDQGSVLGEEVARLEAELASFKNKAETKEYEEAVTGSAELASLRERLEIEAVKNSEVMEELEKVLDENDVLKRDAQSVASLEAQARDFSGQILELQDRLAERDADLRELAESQQTCGNTDETITRCDELEKENTLLKRQLNTNAELARDNERRFKEELSVVGELEKEIKNLKSDLEKSAELEKENDSLRNQLREMASHEKETETLPSFHERDGESETESESLMKIAELEKENDHLIQELETTKQLENQNHMLIQRRSAELEQENASLRQKLETMTERDSHNRQCDRDSEVENLEKIAELEKENECLRQECNQHNDIAQDNAKRYTRQIDRINDVEKENESLRMELIRVTELEKDNMNLRRELVRVADLEKENEGLNKAGKESKKRSEREVKRISRLERENDGLKQELGRMSELEKENEELKLQQSSESDTQASTIAGLKQEIENLRQELSRRVEQEKRTQNVNRELESVVEAGAELRRANRAIRRELECHKKALQKATDDLQTVTVESQRHEQAERELRIKLANAVSPKQADSYGSSTSTSDLKELKSRVHALHVQLNCMRASVEAASLSGEVQYGTLLRHHFAAMQRDRSDVHAAEIDKLKALCLRQQEDVQKLKRSNARSTKKAQEMRERYETTSITIAGYIDRIEDLEEELRGFREESDTLPSRHQAALRLIGELWTRNQALTHDFGLNATQ